MTELERLLKIKEIGKEMESLIEKNKNNMKDIEDLDVSNSSLQYFKDENEDKLLGSYLDQLHRLKTHHYYQLWSSKSIEEIEKEIEQIKKDKNITVKSAKIGDGSYELAATLLGYEKDLKEILKEKQN